METKQTVVVVNDFASIVGGAAKVSIITAIQLANRGHRVIFFSAVGPIDDCLKNVPNLQVECLDQKDILNDPNRLRAIQSGIWNYSAATRLRQILEKNREHAPVVHFHSWIKALSASVFRATLDSNTPAVISLHDYFLACPTGGFLDVRKGEVCTRKPLGLSCISCNCDPRNYYHKLWRVTRGFAQRDLARCPRDCKHFISISPFSEKLLKPFLPTDASIELVRTPVEVEHLPKIDPAKSNDFLFVGRFSPEKGALDFAKAATETGLNAVFIGQGDEEAQIKAACPNATMLKWQPLPAVVERMRSSRALVFPSRWYEGQGAVAIEAAAVGLPVIYSDVTAITADLPNGVSGLSYKSGDVSDLAKMMRQVASDDELARRIGGAAYDWYWEAPWTLEAHTDQLERVYRRIREQSFSATKPLTPSISRS
ncbi:glycosyltransferase family 4 protein [Schlesneria paludicola]|uniref:glycosyltransferase family 4 protein n=1 Tax=Schlesneria paludicola TaxID=360056 RepID=UPI00029AD810|nr:glycosyltransferase family 4 protein [Schlesneria paludicola]